MKSPVRLVLALLLVVTTGACDSDPGKPPAPVIGGDRPVRVVTPPAGRPGDRLPVLIMLHGYGGSADREEGYAKFGPVAAEAGMLYVIPEGTPDDNGNRYWNAGPACCGDAATKPDDSAYLSRVIGELAGAYPIDQTRVYVFGFSNGGFMAHRLACDHADLVTAIVSAAGAGPLDAAGCAPSRPVAVLQVHGDADPVVAYPGGTLDAEYPGAGRTVRDWASRNGCTGEPDAGPEYDLALSADVEAPGATPLDGPETRSSGYSGCRPGGHAELWTIEGGGHAPELSATYARQVIDFFRLHQR